ncbi:MAG: signal peptidase II [Alphaproteobacteria bacterium]|nr:signal peptidase II [Alphaproteobacteria bacterium]
MKKIFIKKYSIAKIIIPLTLALTLLIDQLTKWYMLSWVTRGNVPLFGNAFEVAPYAFLMERITPFFNIVFTWNPGVSFSMFREIGSYTPMILIAITSAITAYFAYLMVQSKNMWERAALALIVGGAIGNLIDRIRFGAVIDFLDFHYAGFHWPAFNFADVFIVFGVVLYIVILLRKK